MKGVQHDRLIDAVCRAISCVRDADGFCIEFDHQPGNPCGTAEAVMETIKEALIVEETRPFVRPGGVDHAGQGICADRPHRRLVTAWEPMPVHECGDRTCYYDPTFRLWTCEVKPPALTTTTEEDHA